MSHKPITCHNVGLSFPQKICFEGFTTQIHNGSRIAIMGQNGSGKSALLKMLQGLVDPSHVDISLPGHLVFGYFSQVIEEFESLSGGIISHDEDFLKAIKVSAFSDIEKFKGLSENE